MRPPVHDSMLQDLCWQIVGIPNVLKAHSGSFFDLRKLWAQTHEGPAVYASVAILEALSCQSC